jgi:hypothetical protein
VGCGINDPGKLTKITFDVANFVYEVSAVTFVDFFCVQRQCVKDAPRKSGVCGGWRHHHGSGC